VQLSLTERLGFAWKGSAFEMKKGKGVDDEGGESMSEGSIIYSITQHNTENSSNNTKNSSNS